MKLKLLSALLTTAGLFVSSALAQTPVPGVPALATSINVNLSVTSTGPESTQGDPAGTTIQAKLSTDRFNTQDFLAMLNAQYNLVPNIKGWKLVGVLPDAADTSVDYRFYLVKTGETPVLLTSEQLALSVDAAAYAYKEQSSAGVLTSGGGKFTYAVTLTAGQITAQGIAKGGYTVRSETVNGTTSTLVVPSAITFRLSGVQDDGVNRAVVDGTMVFTAHKAVDLNDYPAPPVPEPTPAP
ncbi:MAG: hypothetical protein K0R17_192 [Rariglobus sp.]|jgi:hypothetical protein|nr:hypothetical protein [Rariglobus sp.]